ncbi:MAG: hypothetical protein QM783_05440 [Phycisphaerales bacterium]
MLTYPLVLQTIASFTGVATSTSMIIAYRQLKLATRNSQLTFEDAFAREYRQVGNRVPLKAVLGEPLSEDELAAALPEFFWYFDLSNQQVFLRRHQRVSDLTWSLWSEGIRANLARPAFAAAWERVVKDRASGDTHFSELRRFIATQREENAAAVARDPAQWDRITPATQLSAVVRMLTQPPVLTPFPPSPRPVKERPVRRGFLQAFARLAVPSGTSS